MGMRDRGVQQFMLINKRKGASPVAYPDTATERRRTPVFSAADSSSAYFRLHLKQDGSAPTSYNSLETERLLAMTR